MPLPRWLLLFGLSCMLVAYASRSDAAKPSEGNRAADSKYAEESKYAEGDEESTEGDTESQDQEEAEGELRNRQWFLGIVYRTLPRGVEVRRVIRNSPAERAGLERGDVILRIGGFVIDQTQTFPDALQRAGNASVNGRVRMLVRDVRTGRLVWIWARLVQV